jgi:hypothetical protein
MSTLQNTEKEFAAVIKGYYKNLPIDPANMSAGNLQALLKADVPLTASTSTTWFDPVYLGRTYLEGLTRSRKVFGALQKTTYQQLGDSYQNISTDSHTGLGNILESGALFSNTSVPALVDVDSIYPAVIKYDWTNTEVAQALSGIQRSRATPTLQQIRDYATAKFWDAVEMQICGVYNDFSAGGNGTNQGGYGCDSPASASNVAEFECLDRMVTSAAEGAGGTYLSAATDNDLYWDHLAQAGVSTIRFDRSAGAGVGQVRLPTGGTAAAGEAYNIIDELDDLITQAMVYYDSEDGDPDYVLYMSPKAVNKIRAEDDTHRVIDNFSGAKQAINGVSSTPGVTGGKVQLSALRIGDITAPIVSAPYLMGTAASSWLWKNAQHTIGGPGNIYIVPQKYLEFRTLIPLTYRSVQAESALETKHTLYMAGQLVAHNWKAFAALKYIAT